MRGFVRYFRGHLLWLLVNVLALAAFFLLRTQRGVMNAVSAGFSMPLERALGRLCAYVPFSVAELYYAAAVILVVVFLVRSVARIARAEYKCEMLLRRCFLLVNVVLTVYAVFCLLWGVNFYADDFCDKSGVYPEAVAYDDLLAVTTYFAEQAALCADDVPRNEYGVCALSRQEMLAKAPSLYNAMYEEFPFLYIPVDPIPKGIFFSKIMSAMNVTGLYFPFTGESNLNMDFPTALFPATVAHELAHRRGIASEQQCNFLAVLAATRSDDPAYRYSGWLLGYIHLSNALYTADPEAWAALRASLPTSMDMDLRVESAYWAQFEGTVSRASGKAYDAMLKSYGDALGMRSYGAVVDLLVAYYR
ncbi:MAG: DUF3810 domain-containing protein [Ruminococcaceae bacterium]|nr:DUF3810 domain-containing protein [Oscillospiraceae bacterium]